MKLKKIIANVQKNPIEMYEKHDLKISGMVKKGDYDIRYIL